MGADIHVVVELQQDDRSWKVVPQPGRGTHEDGTPCCHWEFYRQYDSFAVLADVRNYNDIKPISEPRGLPEGRVLEDDDYGDHTYSWLLLSEILGYDWDQTVRQSGWIPKDQAERVNAGLAKPKGYDPKTQPELARAEWDETYREACSNLMIFIGHVRATLPGIDPERIRLVFGFDS